MAPGQEQEQPPGVLLHDGIDEPKWKFWKRRRYVVAVACFVGTFNLYSLRVNVSVAMAAMATDNATETSDPDNQDEKFIWSQETQGLILGAFFYGYITTQILGGWFAERVGGTRLLGGGIAVASILTLLTPLFARFGPYWFVGIRVVEGFFSGVGYPSVHHIWSRWAPVLERSRLATFSYSGCQVGTAVTMGVSGVLAEQVGWPSIFYVFGGIALLWAVSWLLLIERSPEFDKYIDPCELKYIQQSLQLKSESNHKAKTYPWKKFVLSPRLWAIVVANFCDNWGFYTMLTQLPLFMKDTMDGFDLEKIGFLSALPYVMQAITMQVSGHIADWLLRRKLLTVTQVRKMCCSIAFIGQAVFLLSAAFLATPAATVACLTLAVTFGGFSTSGYIVNHLDIAPQYAGVLMGIGNTAGTMPGIISPNLSGAIVQTHSRSEWQIVFYITTSLYVFGLVFYNLFGTGERQTWAYDADEETSTKK